jgi:Alg9-like mannosyltransferase family
MEVTAKPHGPVYASLPFWNGNFTNALQLALSVVSPWQFFCSGRTLSNTLETALTAAALSLWFGQSNLISAETRSRTRTPVKPNDQDDPTVLSSSAILQ